MLIIIIWCLCLFAHPFILSLSPPFYLHKYSQEPVYDEQHIYKTKNSHGYGLSFYTIASANIYTHLQKAPPRKRGKCDYYRMARTSRFPSINFIYIINILNLHIIFDIYIYKFWRNATLHSCQGTLVPFSSQNSI